MNSVNELLKLFMRQAELENAMRQPAGARVTEEQELLAVGRRLAANAAPRAARDAACNDTRASASGSQR